MKVQHLSTSGAHCKWYLIVCVEAAVPLCCAICVSTSHQYGLEGDKFLSHAPVFTYSFSAFRILLPGSNLSAQTISSPKPPYLSDARKSEVGEFAYTECRAPQRFWKLFLRRVVQPPGFPTHNIKPKERAQQRVFLHIRGQHLGTLFAGGDRCLGSRVRVPPQQLGRGGTDSSLLREEQPMSVVPCLMEAPLAPAAQHQPLPMPL